MSETEKPLPYYSRYDDHYRTLYSKGIRYWSDGPEEDIARNAERVLSLIREAKPDPKGLKLIEFGCGEGFMVRRFAEMGMVYTGIDYSTHAIRKARERTADLGSRVNLRAMDAFGLDEDILRSRYDILLDMACFHMFVLDSDTRTYLYLVKGLMNPDSAFILTHQSGDEQAYEGEIRSVEEYEKIFQVDLSEFRPWEPWDGTRWVPVELPRFACRPRSEKHYLRTFEQAGFRVVKVQVWGTAIKMLSFILTL